MDDIRFLNRLNRPVITGTPQLDRQSLPTPEQNGNRESFQEVLAQQVASKQSLSFSKHAVSRIEERNIEISQSKMDRLREGMEIAQQKGLDDTLILVDQTAFIVSVKNNTIITAIGENDLKGNAITNINGTVII